MMKYIYLSKWLFFSLSILFFCSHSVFADTIYQWTDPWGQVKYSKKHVQGSMLSELTELPKSPITNEQQKQEAMLNKIQDMENTNTQHLEKINTKKLLRQQKIAREKHCQLLRNTLTNIQLKNSRRYYTGRYFSPGHNFYPSRNYYGRYGYYWDYNDDLLANDLYKEIRVYCR